MWNQGHLDAIFHRADRVTVPWPRYPKRRPTTTGTLVATNEILQQFLRFPPVLSTVDPRELFASQPWVIRHHAAHYLTGIWERTGSTAADMGRLANRYPLITIDECGDACIQAGHHRGVAALINGRPLQARVLDLRNPPDQASAVVAVLPSLTLKPTDGPDAEPLHQAARLVRSGQQVAVASVTSAETILTALGLDSEQIQDRIHVATHARVRTDR